MKLSIPPFDRVSLRDLRFESVGLLLFALAALAQILLVSEAIGNEATLDPHMAPPGPAELVPYDGRWTRIPDDEADALRLSNIDTAIEDLSWIVRGMAGGVLKKSTAPPSEMRFTWDGEGLHQLLSSNRGELKRPVRLDGNSEILIDERGEDFSSSWTWTRAGLQVNWVQAQAYGSNVYRVDPADQTLFVEHRIHITGMSGIDPIVFHSRFARIELPAISAAADPTESPTGPTERR